MAETTGCQQNVYRDTWHRSRCGAKVIEGKVYCKRHDPAPQYDKVTVWYSWERYPYERPPRLLHHQVVAATDKFISILEEGRTKATREKNEGRYFPSAELAIEARRNQLFDAIKTASDLLDEREAEWAKFTQEYPQGETNGKTQ